MHDQHQSSATKALCAMCNTMQQLQQLCSQWHDSRNTASYHLRLQTTGSAVHIQCSSPPTMLQIAAGRWWRNEPDHTTWKCNTLLLTRVGFQNFLLQQLQDFLDNLLLLRLFNPVINQEASHRLYEESNMLPCQKAQKETSLQEWHHAMYDYVAVSLQTTAKEVFGTAQ